VRSKCRAKARTRTRRKYGHERRAHGARAIYEARVNRAVAFRARIVVAYFGPVTRRGASPPNNETTVQKWRSQFVERRARAAV